MPTAQTLRSVPGPGEMQDLVASSVIALADISGISRGELAMRADIDPTKLSKALACKRRFTLEETGRLAAALDVPYMVLLDGGDVIRQRARQGVLYPAPDGPEGPGGQEIQSSACVTEGRGVVIPLRRVPTVPAWPVAA